MFYWLKLIRAFDERLEHPRQAGQGPQRRLHRHRPGGDHRRHLLRAPEGGLHLPAAPRPRLVADEGRRRADHDVADVREGHRPIEGAGLGAAQRRARARHLRQHEHARRQPAGRRRPRADVQDGKDRQCRRRVLRRRREQHRRFPRGASISPASTSCRSCSSARTTSTRTPSPSRRAWRSTMSRIGPRATGSTASRSTATTCWRSTRRRRAPSRGPAAGEGPTLIECKTYRWHGHSEHDKAFYRTDEELAMWKSRDPIPTFTTYLKGVHTLTDEKLDGDRSAGHGGDRRCGGVRDERAGPEARGRGDGSVCVTNRPPRKHESATKDATKARNCLGMALFVVP